MFTTDDWHPGNMMDGTNGMGAGGVWMVLVFGVLFVLLGVLVFLTLRPAGPGTVAAPSPTDRTTPSPREVLDHRLARGEVSPEEYAATRSLLDRP